MCSLYHIEYLAVSCQVGTLNVLVGLLDDFSRLDPLLERSSVFAFVF